MMRTSAGYLYMDKKTFVKSAINIPAQIDLLKQRGLLFPDANYATHCLQTVSYYRLSAYFKPFELNNIKHQFKPETSFQAIWDLYVFDRELRLLIMDALERIEIALRTTLSNTMSTKHGAWWYLDNELFKTSWTQTNNKQRFSPSQIFRNEINTICNNKNPEEYIRHYYQKYKEPEYPPSWMMIESLSFGKCTSIFRYLRNPRDKAEISRVFEFHPHIVSSVLESFRYTRNLCAHHSRLWSRWFVYKSRNLKELQKIQSKPGTLKEQLALIHLFHRSVSPLSSWKDRLYGLFDKYQIAINFPLMGFSEEWQSDLFWEL